MPIYMDRHEMEGVTAKVVADAHQSDLRLQAKHGIKLLTYWFDEDRGSAFCLMEAPTEATVIRLHEEAHGSVPHKIIEVDPSAVQAFLGRIEDLEPPSKSEEPEPEALADSAFRAIMFTDMKDSTTMITSLGDKRALTLFRAHNTIVRDALRLHDGREIQHTGDGFMVSFASPSHAVTCAIALQKSFSTRNHSRSDAPISVRIGICAGEPVEEDQRLFGSTVPLTPRICDKARPDQILVAPVIRDLCEEEGFSFTDQGETALKGFSQPLRLYEVDW